MDRLWTIFKPGEIVWTSSFDNHQAFRLVKIEYLDYTRVPVLKLEVSYIDYDGRKIGTRSKPFYIISFTGSIPIQELSIYPISYHRDAVGLQKLLIARGRRFETFMARQYCEYDGVSLEERKSASDNDDSNIVKLNVPSFHIVKWILGHTR